jgi:PAS domain S-box-containing protein
MLSFSGTSDDRLRRTQQSNAAFINSLPDGFELLELVYDNQGNIADFLFVEVNAAYERQSGLKAADILGNRKKTVAPAAEQRWYDTAVEAVKTGRTISYQYHNPATNAYYDTQFIPMPPNQLVVLFKDVTKGKKAENALTQTKQNLQDIITQSPVAFALFDKTGLLIQVNNAWVKQWQIPPELVVDKYNVLESKQIFDIGLLPIVKRAFAGETIKSYDLEFDASLEPQTKGTGRKRWLSVTAYPIKNESGALTVVILTEDISDRMKTEETLRESEQRYRELYESFDEAFIVIDWEFTVKNWNRAAERVTTVPAKDALGRKVYDVLPEFLTVDINPYVESLKEKKPARFMMNVVSRQTKKPSVFEISTYPSELGITIIVQDKTAQEEAKRLSAIGATAGMVGHDIRNPLQAVLSETYLLKEDLKAMPDNDTKKDVTESLDSIENNVLYINKIVQDLQDYARPVTPEISDVNLPDVFANIFKNVTIPDSIKLILRVEDAEKIRTDPMLLQRALTNLVTNAVQAMPNGGELKIYGQKSNNRVVVTVSDTGVGIPEEVKPRLFTPMMTTKAKGQGFGLAVSKRLIEALKGSISFRSESGKGTEFRVDLPE